MDSRIGVYFLRNLCGCENGKGVVDLCLPMSPLGAAVLGCSRNLGSLHKLLRWL
ncbi:hypothetical protein NQZ68_014971 [Dissostichus eleginoides]|nr:hypothetical protein NQZ68_014971 [Dissostichus eleginoides]